MKKLLVLLAALFAFVGMAFAAVDINTASQAELETLKGIGPVKAKAIIEYREKNGPFKSIDELDKVKGIGSAVIDKLRPDVTVGGKTPPAAKPAPAPAAKSVEPVKPAEATKTATPVGTAPAAKSDDTKKDDKKAKSKKDKAESKKDDKKAAKDESDEKKDKKKSKKEKADGKKADEKGDAKPAEKK